MWTRVRRVARHVRKAMPSETGAIVSRRHTADARERGLRLTDACRYVIGRRLRLRRGREGHPTPPACSGRCWNALHVHGGRAKAARYALRAYTCRSWCQSGGASTPENTKSQRDRANATKDRTINSGDMGLSRVE